MRTLKLFCVSILLAGCGEGAPSSGQMEAPANTPHFADPDVHRIHTRMMAQIAPDQGWDRARYLEFDWAVRRTAEDTLVVRSHRWDRYEGRARVRQTTPDGEVVTVFQTQAVEEGEAWLNGEPVTDERRTELLRSAYRAHINDSYWLIMPYKWTDPGVQLAFQGERIDEEGRSWEVVELAFDDGTGLTPQNRYLAFINPETGRMERWHHFPNLEAEPAPADWADWQRFGPIELAVNRRSEGRVRISFPHLRVETSLPDGVFTGP
jgi:hypothetical protein